MPAKILERDPETARILSIRCHCGTKIELDGYDVECPSCDQPYNTFGQMLRREGHGDCFCPECC